MSLAQVKDRIHWLAQLQNPLALGYHTQVAMHSVILEEKNENLKKKLNQTLN